MKATKTTPKEAAKSIIRILLITAAATIGTFGLMAEPLDNDPWLFEKFFLLKAIAVAGWVLACCLYDCWRKTDKWLAAYDKRCEEA